MIHGISDNKKYWILIQDYVACEYCKKKWDPDMKKFFVCGKCKEIRYCSKDCQTKHWLSPPREGHKLQCLFFKNLFKSKETTFRPELHNLNVIERDEIDRIISVITTKLPKDSALDDICGCLNEWDIHSSLSAHTGLCSRLGCYKFSLYVACQNVKVIPCEIRSDILHEIGIKYFCSYSCRKATSIFEPTGIFWKTEKMEDSPAVNYKKLISLFGKPIQEKIKERVGYFPSGDQFISNNASIKLLAIELFVEIFCDTNNSCCEIDEMIKLIDLNYDLMCLPPVDKINQPDLVIRLIQVIEQLCFSSFEFTPILTPLWF